jgi:hypothetical protein
MDITGCLTPTAPIAFVSGYPAAIMQVSGIYADTYTFKGSWRVRGEESCRSALMGADPGTASVVALVRNHSRTLFFVGVSIAVGAGTILSTCQRGS